MENSAKYGGSNSDYINGIKTDEYVCFQKLNTLTYSPINCYLLDKLLYNELNEIFVRFINILVIY